MEKSFEKVSVEFRKEIEEVLKMTIIESFQKEMVEKKKASGDNNIYFVNGADLINHKHNYECFVDGLHPTDFGFYEMAKSLYKIIRKYLNK